MKNQKQEKFLKLLEQGILYEDMFIEKYMHLIRDADFLQAFGEDIEQAKHFLSVLIKESTEHKEYLNKIKNYFTL